MKRALCIVLLAASGLASALGCAMGPNYKRPEVATPEQYRGVEKPAADVSLADKPWWDLFQDENLKVLIDEALKNSPDAQVAAWRVEQYRAQAGIARAPLFPQLDASGAWTRRDKASSYVDPTSGNTEMELYTAQFALSWEIDLWGRLRRLNEAGRAQYLASEEARRGVMLSLVANVASGYYELCALDQYLDIARNTTQAFQTTFDLFDRKLKGGAASALQTSSAQGDLGNVAAQVPDLEASIVQKENALCVLLGRPPGPIKRSALPSTETLPLDVPAGLPSALLERRPDVREAEEALVAYNANVGAAKASMFPTISLTGLLGGVSPEVNQLFGDGKRWSVSAGLFQPLFHGGALWFQYEAAKALYGQSLAQYEQAVNNAFAEASTNLVTNQKLAESEEHQRSSVTAYREAVRLSNERYNSGLSSYFEVLLMMERLYPAEQFLITYQYRRLANFIQLYKALGGGWQTPDQLQPRPAPDQGQPAPTPAQK
jgi:outer membrane protein, multidrug efflux system